MFDDEGQYEKHVSEAQLIDGRLRAPAINYLDGQRLARGLRAGIARVLADKDALNKINVFPVADGDTGTNIASTLGTVLVRLDESEQHAGRLLAGVADAALDGARGNSGAILAQFFQGLSDHTADLPRLDAKEFADAVKRGARYAREALSQPREGTILSVLSEYAKALSQQRQPKTGATDMRVVLQHGLAAARRALANTPKQLEVLRKSGVVDAGAKGFVDLLEGVDDYLRSGSLREQTHVADIADADAFAAELDSYEESEFRFCTECLITGDDIDRRKLREQTAAIGDSVVIAGSRRKVRLHIHTDHPDQVFELAARQGVVSGQKADDMHTQAGHVHHQSAQKVAVLMDSAGDVPEDLIEEHNIHLVSLRVHFGDTNFLDKVTLTPEELFERMKTDPEHPSTSQPSPADLRRQFDFLASHYESVLSVNVTSKASGTWQAAASAAQRATQPEKLHVLDTGNATLGQGLIAVYAAECAKAGYNLETTLALCEAIGQQTKAYAYVRDLRYAVRGGRVPGGVKAVADLLRLTPILGNRRDGRITAVGVLAGRTKLPERLTRFISARHASDSRLRIFVGHGDAPADCEELAQRLRTAYPSHESCHQTEVGTALGVHGGPGLVVVGLQHYVPPAELAAQLGLEV
ncbi:MAG: DegV family protein [Pseudomonadota bacterium]